MQPVLETERLRLRPFEMRDVPELHVFLSDPEATRFWADPHLSVAQTERFVSGTIAASPERCCDFVVEYEGRAIGKAGMWEKPEIGFFILPGFQRRGFAFEALSAIIPHLFSLPGCDHLTADVDPRNSASLHLLGRLGFQQTGHAKATLQIAGKWCDSLYLRLDRPA